MLARTRLVTHDCRFHFRLNFMYTSEWNFMSRRNEFVVNFKFTDTTAHTCTCIFIYTMFKEKWNPQYIPYFVMNVHDHERMQLESSSQSGCNWGAEEQTWLGSSSGTDVIEEQQSKQIQLGSSRWRRNWVRLRKTSAHQRCYCIWYVCQSIGVMLENSLGTWPMLLLFFWIDTAKSLSSFCHTPGWS